MRTSCCRAILTILIALFCVPTANAQHTYKGLWGGVGLGYGSADVACEQCFDVDREGGWIASVKVGHTLSDHMLIAGDVLAWVGSPEGTSVVMATLTLAASYYFPRASGLFLKAGFGSSMYREPKYTRRDRTEGGLSGAGPGIILGMGNDFRVGRNVSLTLTGDFIYGWVGAVYDDPSHALIIQGATQNFVSVTLGVTFH